MKRILITGGSGFIGTNLVDLFLQNNLFTFINIDIESPKKTNHTKFWHRCDILDYDELQRICIEYNPEIIIHLAAETDVSGKDMDYYKVNTIGTKNLLEVIAHCQSVRRLIVASTQYVYQSDTSPLNDDDYCPLGVYGESKVITERLVRSSNLNVIWTIIRPTNIWGPWHNVYPEGLWRQILKGRYLHPAGKPVYRSYGYIGNVVQQIIEIIDKPSVEINRKILYVGDQPINLYDWVNAFSLNLINKNVVTVPRFVLAFLAIIGDLLDKLNIKFPLTTSRYHNMIVDNPAPMEKTFAILGHPKYTLQQGVEITVNWYLTEYLKNRV